MRPYPLDVSVFVRLQHNICNHTMMSRATLRLGWNYADALYTDPDATLDDIREAVRTLEDLERTTRRVLGGTHPFATGIVDALQQSRATLRAREAGQRVVFQYT